MISSFSGNKLPEKRPAFFQTSPSLHNVSPQIYPEPLLQRINKPLLTYRAKNFTLGITENEIKRPMTVATTKRWSGGEGGTKHINNFVM